MKWFRNLKEIVNWDHPIRQELKVRRDPTSKGCLQGSGDSWKNANPYERLTRIRIKKLSRDPHQSIFNWPWPSIGSILLMSNGSPIHHPSIVNYLHHLKFSTFFNVVHWVLIEWWNCKIYKLDIFVGVLFRSNWIESKNWHIYTKKYAYQV